MSNKPRFPFGGSNRDDEDDDDDKGQSGSGSRPNSPFNRGGNRPDDRKSDKPAIGSKSPFGRRNDDDDDYNQDDDQDRAPAKSSSSRPGGFGTPNRSPFNKPDDDDVDDEDDSDDEDDKPRPAFGSRPAANSSPFGSKPSSSFGGNKPNDPPKPGGSPFGGNKPASGPSSGGKPGDAPRPGGSPFGSNKPNDPPKPGGSPFGGNKPASGPSSGGKPGDAPRPGGSPFGGNKPASGGPSSGNKPGDAPKPGGSPFGGNKPGDAPRPGGSPFGGNKPASGQSTGSKPSSPFGSKTATKDDDKKDDKPAGGGPLGGFKSPFGAKPGDKPADKKDDKPAGSGSPLGGLRSPFGAKPGDKPADKKDDKPAGGGPLGGFKSPFGAKPGDKPADKKDDKPAGGGSPLGGLRSPFGAKPGDKPADKGSDKKDDKPASGGLFGGKLPFGAKPADDKKDNQSAPAKPAFGSSSAPARPGTPSAPAGKASAVAAPPKTAGAAADPKKAGSKVPPARGEKVAKPLDRASKVHVQAGLSLDQKLDLLGYLLMGSGVLLFFAIVNPSEGSVTTTIAKILSGLFGRWGTVALLLPFFGIGLWLFVRHFSENPLVIKVERVIGYVLMFIVFVTTVHFVVFLFKPEPSMARLLADSDAMAKTGEGGGWLGSFMYKLLIQVTGEWGVPVLLVGIWLISIYLALALTMAELTGYVQSVFHWFGRVRGSYVEHRRAAAQAKAASMPLTIETPDAVGAGAAAGATPASAALAAPGNKRLPERAGAPRLAPATAGTAAAQAPAAKSAAAPFGKAPVQGAAAKVADVAEAEDEELEKAVTPAAAPRPAPAPLGSRPAASAPAKPGLFGSRPAAAPAKNDEETDEAEPAAKPAPAAAAPARLGNPFAPKPAANQPDDKSAKPGPFGAKSSSGPAAKPGTDAVKDEPDDEDADKEADKAEPAKPASPIGNRPNPLGGPKPPSTPFGAKPASGTKPDDKDAEDEDKDADKEADKAEPAKPATSVGNRPNPFGGPKPPSSPFGKPAPKPADADKADDAEDEDVEADKAEPARPATPVGNRPNPFGGPKAPSSPFGKPAPKPADADKADDTEDEDAEADKAEPAKPASPVGNRPNPFGGGSKPASPFGGPKPSSPFGKPAPKPADDKSAEDEDAEAEQEEPAKPATPVGNRTNPFGGGSKPSGSAPTGGPARSFGNPFAKKPTEPIEAEDEQEAEPADLKPATPIGNRPAPAVPPNPSGPRPVPKNNLATRPPLDGEDEDEKDNPKYVSADDDDDLPPSNGPRPTVSGSVGTPPSTMPRPANPVLPRGQPGKEPPRMSGGSAGGPLGGSGSAPGVGGGDKPNSPFGQRPPSAVTTPKVENSGTASAPATAAAVATTTTTTTPAVPAKPESPDKRLEPAAKPPLEGVIVRSKAKVTPGLPDFYELLESGSEKKISDEVLQERARVIEETLSSFSAPGKVVEINPGPVITQFGVEPDYLTTKQGKKIRVKVSQIAKLDADLALALAARSIRIEAPVPGKGYVGIEVPNSETALVGLRDIMDSDEFQKINSKLRIGLGKSVDGAPIAADLTQMPHLLIAGTTGSGKSVCVNAIIACLLLQNTPDDLKMVMVDPKRVELTGYNGIPHLVSPVVVDLERIVGVLKWVTREMEERYKRFSQAGARNILDYNGRLKPNEPKLPYLVVVVDELADLMMLAPEETEKVLTRLAQMARATGIHLIISTQRPSVDVVTGLIKANFPARISFAVASSVDSRVILDQPGAEKLLGRGDMLFQSPDAAAPLRMQGVFVDDAAINRITSYWKGHRPETEKAALSSPVDFNRAADPVQSRTERFGPADSRASTGNPFGSAPTSSTGSASVVSKPAAPANGETAGEDDEMYEEALDLVKKAGKPSISLLQRRLRIGYTRAARLIELMEKRGAISPAEARSASGDVADDTEAADQDKTDANKA